MEETLVEWVADQQIQLQEMKQSLEEVRTQIHGIFLGYVLCTIVLIVLRVSNYKRSKNS